MRRAWIFSAILMALLALLYIPSLKKPQTPVRAPELRPTKIGPWDVKQVELNEEKPYTKSLQAGLYLASSEFLSPNSTAFGLHQLGELDEGIGGFIGCDGVVYHDGARFEVASYGLKNGKDVELVIRHYRTGGT